MIYLYLITGVLLVLSVIKSREKTVKSLKTALSVFLKMCPMLLFTLSLVSLVLYFLPDYVIAEYLGGTDTGIGIIFASLLGSVSLLPGFITFPLSGLLLNQGVSYTVLAAFTTTLMMVGVVTFPMEKNVLGGKLALVRNISAFIIAITVSIAVGLIYGESLV